jgi:hypothetical protein
VLCPPFCSFLALSLALASCGSSGDRGRDGAVVADGSREASGDAARTGDGPPLAADVVQPACAPLAPAAGWAGWPMPDPAATSYDTTTPGVVLDRVTGLEWQRDVPAEMLDWQGARAACACLSLGGHRDWRLPSRIELVSIVDYTRHDPAIDSQIFPDTPTDWFWSASPVAASDPPAAWYVAFFDGDTHHAELTVAYHHRCVRGGTAPGPRFTTPGDGTVLDWATHLTWQASVDDSQRTFAEASAACAALPLAGGGWRLPTMKELQTLIDEGRSDPAIDPVFPGTPGEGFWAANSLAGLPGNAWFVSFAAGIAYNSAADHFYRVRCAR